MNYISGLFLLWLLGFVTNLQTALVDTSTNTQKILLTPNYLLQLLIRPGLKDISQQILDYVRYEETDDALIKRTKRYQQPCFYQPHTDDSCVIAISNRSEAPHYRESTKNKKSKIYESYDCSEQPWQVICNDQLRRYLKEKMLWQIPHNIKSNDTIKTTSIMKSSLMASRIPIDGIDSNKFAVSEDRSKLAVMRVIKNGNNQILRQKAIWIYDPKTKQTAKFNLPAEYKRRLREYPLEKTVDFDLTKQGYQSYVVCHDYHSKEIFLENFYKLLEISNNGKLLALADNQHIYVINLNADSTIFNIVKSIPLNKEPVEITPGHEFVSPFNHLYRAFRFNHQATHLAVRLNHKQSGQETVEIIDLKNLVDKTFLGYCKEKKIVANQIEEKPLTEVAK